MDNIGTFNQNLNESVDFHKAYKRWKSYRESIHDFIIQQTHGIRGNVIILGAGNGKDLKIKELIDCFDQVWLTDVDEKALKQGIAYQEIESNQIQWLCEDYLGLDKEYFNGITNRICMSGINSFEEWLIKGKKAILSHQLLQEKVGLNDVVIVMPIYTQLFFNQINVYLEAAFRQGVISEDFFGRFQRLLLDQMPDILNHFNQSVKRLAKPEGIIVDFSDIIEDEKNGYYVNKLWSAVDFQGIIDKYHQQYGMGIGAYGLLQMVEGCQVLETRWFKWPFEENRTFIVKGCAFKVSNETKGLEEKKDI